MSSGLVPNWDCSAVRVGTELVGHLVGKFGSFSHRSAFACRRTSVATPWNPLLVHLYLPPPTTISRSRCSAVVTCHCLPPTSGACRLATPTSRAYLAPPPAALRSPPLCRHYLPPPQANLRRVPEVSVGRYWQPSGGVWRSVLGVIRRSEGSNTDICKAKNDI